LLTSRVMESRNAILIFAWGVIIEFIQYLLPNVLDEPRGCLARSLRSRIRNEHLFWL
jgi:hypothetical protein